MPNPPIAGLADPCDRPAPDTSFKSAWTRHDDSQAQAHIKRYCTSDNDGADFNWLYSEDHEYRKELPAHQCTPTGERFEWSDGSAIVTHFAWDYGIHRDLVDTAQAIIDALPAHSVISGYHAQTLWPDTDTSELGPPPS